MAATPVPDPASQTPGTAVRRLLRGVDRAALATRLPEGAETPEPGSGGWPYASLVLLAVDQTAAPLLLISDLAEHTKNIRADPRVALLVDGTAGLADPLTGARASLLGRAAPCADASALARYVARHPSAAGYAGFKDFHLFRVSVTAAHLVAGFGRIHWAAASDILDRPAPALVESEAEIVAHMNQDHADALDLVARRRSRGCRLADDRDRPGRHRPAPRRRGGADRLRNQGRGCRRGAGRACPIGPRRARRRVGPVTRLPWS
jgi:hypothetical protein